MKAVLFHEHGGVEKLRCEDVPQPVPADDEILVQVKACALNYLDIWGRQGLPGIKIPLPHISGSDISGIIAAKGKLVENIQPGDRVILSPGISCGHCAACLSGWDNACRAYKIIGYLTDGGYAEYVKVPSVNAIPMPNGLGFEEAASVPLVFLTAWHMLVSRARIQPGEAVLILGAGSGVGIAGIQIAKLWGAKVITTAGTDEKLKKARQLGADEVINHSTQDVSEEIRKITNKRGVDIVFEHVGEATWESSVNSLAYGGRLVTCGSTTGYKGQTDIRFLFSKQLSILGSYMGSKSELLTVIDFFRKGRLRPAVDSVYPLNEAAKAQTRMERREHFGKIVLKP